MPFSSPKHSLSGLRSIFDGGLCSHAFLAWLLITLWLLPLAGCGGCWSSNPQQAKKKTPEEELEEAEKKKKKLAEKPKPDFEMAPTIILPNESGQDVEDDGNPNKPPTAPKVVFFTKPGHWVAGMQQAKANNFDFQGELRTFPMDQFELPLDVQFTDFRLSISRPASLPKGQIKRFETLFYLPKRTEDQSGRYTLRTELRASRGSRLPEMMAVSGNALREHEYYFVVLAKNQASYVDIAKLDSIQLQGDRLGYAGTPGERERAAKFYHPVFPRVDKNVPLPSHPLAWTMIAYILWDDLDPTVLTKEQQSALLDWLHWGGQLIISGPNSLDRLKQTFLEPYLPATSGQARQIGPAELATLNEKWSIEARKPLKRPANIVVLQDKPLVGVELQKQADAEWIPDTGELAIERRLGRGRIVVTAFSLSAMPYRFWASRDNFFNCALLRKPAREFQNRGEQLYMEWTGKLNGAKDDSALLATRLRYFSRDINRMREAGGQPQVTPPPTPEHPGATQTAEVNRRRPPTMLVKTPSSHDLVDERLAGFQSNQQSGVAGWNDFSGAADAALAALNDASGIKIPRADFVLRVLLVYLAVLVPLNWLIFWLIGRVEYAWLAAPVIAIVGALAVVRLAQLDIGFARSRSEIAVLEAHANYPRAHVTRFTALYTSLSTSYDLRFEDPGALALPFALSPTHTRKVTRPAADVVLTQDQTIELSDVQVQSNSTGKLHVEQMIDLPAAFTVTGDDQRGWQLENGSQFTLRQAGVLRCRADGVVETAYFPDIEPGATVRLNFLRADASVENWVPQWDRSPMMSPLAPVEDENRVSLHRLTQHAARQLELLPGEMRLIAWTNETVPGLQIRPVAAQSTTYTLVLVHLQRPPLPKPEQDVRLRVDVMADVIAEDVKSDDDTSPD